MFDKTFSYPGCFAIQYMGHGARISLPQKLFRTNIISSKQGFRISYFGGNSNERQQQSQQHQKFQLHHEIRC